MLSQENQANSTATQGSLELSDKFVLELIAVNKNLKKYERKVREAVSDRGGLFEFIKSINLPSGLASNYEYLNDARKALHLQLKVIKKLSKSYDILLSLAGNNPELSNTSPENLRKQFKICAEASIELFDFCQFVKDFPCTNEEATVLNDVFLNIELFTTSYKDQPWYKWELTSVQSFIESKKQNGY